MSSQTRAMHLLLTRGRFVTRSAGYTAWIKWPQIVESKYTRLFFDEKTVNNPLWLKDKGKFNRKFRETLELAYQLHMHGM